MWLLAPAAGTPATPLTEAIAGGLRWTPDGAAILYRARVDAISVIDTQGKGPGRLLVDLSGKPGQMAYNGTPTDGRFIYFVWTEDLGDVWVMDAIPAAR